MDDEPLATDASAEARDSKALSSTTAPGPPRIWSLDVLRGVGVFGMLAILVPLYAFPGAAYWNPTAYGDLRGINWWVWLATFEFAGFMPIFAMLFGAGILIGRAGDRAISAWRIHVRRMATLLVLGLLHAHLLWYGDMLVPLALCGSVVFFARRLSPGWLLLLGGLAFVTGSALSLALTWSTAQSDPVALAAWRAQWTPRPEVIALEIAQYRGGWAEQMAHRVPAAVDGEVVSFVTRLFWQMAGLMLIGMALLKQGVLSAARSHAFYLRMGALGFGAGILLRSLGIWRGFATKWDLLDYVLIGQQLHDGGVLFVALGWIALVMLLIQRAWSLRPMAAVGRMALTNYLLQSLICTTIFYGHGFGLFGRVDRAGQLAIVMGVWAFQLLASSVWLSYFAMGPLEWLTRWLVFRRRPSLVRSSPAIAGV